MSALPKKQLSKIGRKKNVPRGPVIEKRKHL